MQIGEFFQPDYLIDDKRKGLLLIAHILLKFHTVFV
jgi:hypothetical protein